MSNARDRQLPDDLFAISVAERQSNGRVNVSDIYRVAAQLLNWSSTAPSS